MRVGIYKFFEFISKMKLHFEVRYLLSVILVLFLAGCKTEKKSPLSISTTAPGIGTGLVTPSVGSINGGTLIAISGNNFDTITAVSIGNQPCSIVSTSATQVVCRTPPNAAGTYDISLINQNRQIVTAPSSFTYQIAPVITSISPSSGFVTGATLVTVSGSGFLAGATVSFGGSVCSGVAVVSSTSITCTTSAHAAGVVNVVVTNTDSQTGTALSGFTYRGAPTITNVSPIGGPLAGGTLVTITGTGFYAGSTVTLGGLTCTGVNVVSPTSITCTTPANVMGAVGITVTNADTQSGSSAGAFTYRPAPAVSSVAPNQGALGGGTAITITGTNFVVGATATLGGSACTSLLVLNATTITCTTPMQLTTGPVTVAVTNPDTQTGSLANGFTYYLAPTVTSASPNSGIISGGTTLTITGTNFRAGATVDISGAACSPVTVVSPTQITCITAAHIAGVENITVTNTDLQSGIVYAAYTYRGAPTVTGVSPSAGAAIGGTVVTVSGTGFYTGANVTFGGVACTSINVASPTALTCTTPANPAGAVTVAITNADTQTGSMLSAYTYQPAPTITSISPVSGALAGGTNVTITGTGFLTGAIVDFGGSACNAVTVVNPTTITCTTSAHLAGAVTAKVINTDSQFGTLNTAYTYIAGPSISTVKLTAAPSVNPAAGPLAGGTSLTIAGTNFVTGATVSVGGVACTTTSVTATSIVCTTGAHANAAVNVVVTNPDTQSSTLSSSFVYQGAPTITKVQLQFAPTLTPPTGALAGGTDVIITGSGFVSGITVTFGATACTNLSILSTTSIYCKTPAGAAGPVSVTVTNADAQTATLAAAFTYQAAPTITSITVPPLSVVAGSISGGTTVNISGTGFIVGPPATTVTIGGVGCTTVSVTATTISCTTGAHAAGVTDVAVINPDLQTATATGAYSYQAAPTVTSVSPNGGALAGGTNVTVHGTGFVTGATVNFGAAACTAVTVVSSTAITCTTPANVAGAVAVTVTNTDTQSGNLAAAYTYQAAPTVTSIALTSGSTAGGTNVTITGTGFLTGATANLGGANCTGLTVVSATSITCTTSAHIAGAVNVNVVNADTQVGTLAGGYTYILDPVVSSVTRNAGALGGGTAVTITGSNFVAGSTVDFGGAACSPVTVVSATSITCTTAAHAAGAVTVKVTSPNTQFGSLANGYTYQAAPTVTSVTLPAGLLAGGTNVTIAGTGFLTGATVDFGGSACTGVTVVSATSITCTTSAHAAGAVAVTVTNTDAQSGILAGGFTYQAAPTITNVVASSGTANGGTNVTITGTGFLAGATVKFGTSACTAITVVSATSITCTTPAHASGIVNITVTNTDTQSATLASGYIYIPDPTVTSVALNVGALGGGTAVTITGTNFVSGATVDFGGSACNGVTVVNATTITCTTTAHAAGAVTVKVTNPNTQFGTLANAYTYQAAPAVTSISQNAGALAGGTNVTITGTGFLAGATVSIGGSTCSPVTVVSSTSITCTTSAHAAGTVAVNVTNTDTQSGGGATYTYQAAPTVSTVTPNAGPLSGMASVTITGTGFVNGLSVDFGGSLCTLPVVMSPTTITCSTPAHAAGAVTVKVTNADTQSGSAASAYTYQAAPAVTGVTPSAGALGGATPVTITGSGFVTGATVSFGGSACTAVTVVSATSITCTTPAHAAGAVTVTVTNADTQSGNKLTAFTYQAAPTVTSVSPASGFATGATAVTITGTNFVAGATVSFGGSACTAITVVSATSITCTTPAHAAGLVSVAVTNADTQAGTGVGVYTYQAAPTVTAISPNIGPLAGGQNVTITGTGFVAGAGVTIGGTACTNVSILSATSITCTTPAHVAGASNVVVTNTDTQAGTLTSGYTYQSMAYLQWQVGFASPTPPNPDSYGSTSVNVTHTYTLKNVGDAVSTTISLSNVGGTPAAWTYGTDTCSGLTLAAGATCTVQVTFLAQFLTPATSYSTTLSATAATGGTTTNGMSGSVP